MTSTVEPSFRRLLDSPWKDSPERYESKLRAVSSLAERGYGLPIVSSARQPKSCSAPGFQSVTRRLLPPATIASGAAAISVRCFSRVSARSSSRRCWSRKIRLIRKKIATIVNEPRARNNVPSRVSLRTAITNATGMLRQARTSKALRTAQDLTGLTCDVPSVRSDGCKPAKPQRT